MQVSKSLRKTNSGYMHWCVACEELHPLPNSWSFNGNLEKPTFTPSFKHTGIKTVKVNGKWTGEWVLDADGAPVPEVCHYILTDGVVNYCADCTHPYAGKSVLIAELPEFCRDEDK